jgi:hypothetical protein
MNRRLRAALPLLLALPVTLLFTTRDPRIVLIKPSFYTGLGGLYVLYTSFAGRPLVFDVSKPFATSGDPEREHALERAWRHRAGFRREQRLIAAVRGRPNNLRALPPRMRYSWSRVYGQEPVHGRTSLDVVTVCAYLSTGCYRSSVAIPGRVRGPQ